MADIESFNIEKHKKLINDGFAKVKTYMEGENFLEPRFLQYTFDNSVFNFGDVVFKNVSGETVRWRLVSNAWGDEVLPMAEALKATGHKDITYIGTAGAFKDKGLEVGDVVIPSHVSHENEESAGKPLRGDVMPVELGPEDLKTGGTVTHVSTPFIETNEWLERMAPHADTVEIETSYLRDVFKSTTDKLRVYLMVSDIMGSEGETLAAGSASKRKKGKLALIDALFARDNAKKLSPIPTSEATKVSKLRNRVLEVFPKKGTIFQYLLFSLFEDQASVPSHATIKQRGDELKGFSDNTFTKKTIQAGELLEKVVRKIAVDNPMPKIGFEEKFLDGKWHPGTDKLNIEIYAGSDASFNSMQAILDQYESLLHAKRKEFSIKIVRGPPTSGMHALRPRGMIDDDYVIRRYAWAGMKQGGLDFQLTNSGNFSYGFLPTETRSEGFGGGEEYRYLAYFPGSNATNEAALAAKNAVPELSGFDEEYLLGRVEQTADKLDSLGDSEAFKASAKMSIVGDLPGGALAAISPEFDDNKGIIFHLKITQEGLDNPLVVLEESAHLDQIIRSSSGWGNHSFFSHPLTYAEMQINAEAGSKRAKYEMALAELDVIDKVRNLINDEVNIYDNDAIEEYLKKREKDAVKLVRLTKRERTAENKIRRQSVPENWKTVLKELDRADEKLDDYIARNDRAQVKKLIEKYMPWNEMEPSEIALWRRWLEAIGTPNDINSSDNQVLFRGLADDLIKDSVDGGHYLMSTMLTKNQGSYSRRLRSLKTVLKKMRTLGDRVHQKYNNVTSLFKGHSLDPVGSSLLSMSTFNVAQQWSSSWSGGESRQATAAMSLNPDRFLYSVVSGYDNEVERLIPLIIFPDEIIHLEEVEGGNINYGQFRSQVEEKLGRSLTSSEISENGSSIDALEKTKRWWNSILPNNFSSNHHVPSCNEMMNYFRNI